MLTDLCEIVREMVIRMTRNKMRTNIGINGRRKSFEEGKKMQLTQDRV
jgi:hypothetical protein